MTEFHTSCFPLYFSTKHSDPPKTPDIKAKLRHQYNDLFAVRGGYFHENKFKGNRKYFTLGLGLRYELFGIDFAYLVPLAQNNPLAETLRFTLHFDFATKAREEDITIEE